MILWSQCEDLSKILLVSKFEMNRPNIKLIIAFCAIMALSGLKGFIKIFRIDTLMAFLLVMLNIVP